MSEEREKARENPSFAFSFFRVSLFQPKNIKNLPPQNSFPFILSGPYTAVNLPGDVGTIDLVVKDYEGGKMSSALCALKPGQVRKREKKEV